MRRAILLSLCAVLAIGFSACNFTRGIKGSGVRKSEKRDLKPFSAVDTTGAYEVQIACQKPAAFEIEADDNILPLIKTDVRDGVLYVSNQESYNSAKAVTLRIALPELSAVSSRGAGDINVMDANGNDLKIESTGAASIKAAGKVKTATFSSTGAGDIEASKLVAEKAKVSVAGAASVHVYASEQLDVSVSGAGSVSYGGNPKTVNKSVSGFGSVNKKAE